MTLRSIAFVAVAAASLAACSQPRYPAYYGGYQPAQAPQGHTSAPRKWETRTSANVALATDYKFRGVSQTDERPAVQGGFDVEHGPFYAGTWASNVDFGPAVDANVELDVYAGAAANWRGVTWDGGVIYYAYPESADAFGEADYVEIYGGAERGFGPVTLRGSVSYSPEYTFETGSAVYAQVGAAFEVMPEMLTVDANVGATAFDDETLGGDDYQDYNIGATLQLKGYAFDLRYHDTADLVGFNEDNKVVVTASKAF